MASIILSEFSGRKKTKIKKIKDISSKLGISLCLHKFSEGFVEIECVEGSQNHLVDTK